MTQLINLEMFLKENNYTFCTYFDNSINTREICVKTEEATKILCYRFDKYGVFERMWYSICNYNALIDTMLQNNLLTNQFDDIDVHYGTEKAKIYKKKPKDGTKTASNGTLSYGTWSSCSSYTLSDSSIVVPMGGEF